MVFLGARELESGDRRGLLKGGHRPAASQVLS